MAVQRVFHWKHGWIPLDHYAALEATNGRESTVKLRTMPPKLTSPVRSMDEMPASLQDKIDTKLETVTGLSEPALAAKVQANLTRLYGQGNSDELAWYGKEGADIASRAAAIRAKFPSSKLTAEQLTGMVAVTSAQKRWLENKDFAQAIATKLAEDKPFPVTPEMIADYNAFVGRRKGGLMAPHPDLKPGTYRPSQLPTDFAVAKTPGMPRHKNTDFVVSAARIYRGESTVDQAVNGPKQRSFVNNLMNPDDPRSATVDTWHYRAAMAGIPLTKTVGPKGNQHTYSYTLEQWADRELARQDGRADALGYDHSKPPTEAKNLAIIFKATVGPQDFFQSGPASKADKYDGKYGTYPWFVKQTQAAASKVGVAPSALQAVAWYAVGGGQ
jgi:hypothetical protein